MGKALLRHSKRKKERGKTGGEKEREGQEAELVFQ